MSLADGSAPTLLREPSRVAKAPGKLVLLGDYAVLDGGPALVLAVNRGVRCNVFPGGSAVRIETPDGDTRFVAPALEGAPPGRYVFSDWNPVRGLREKPGFGGSAAACVAACLAAGRPGSDALAIHRAVQGSGSGVDVRASLAGGLLRVEGESARHLPVVSPSVIWSGRSARTGPRVARYLAWSERQAFLSASAAAVARFEFDPVEACAMAYAALLAMSQAAGVPWLTPELAHIVDLARVHGGAAKPSGAGGGDCAVAWFPDSEKRTAFEAACRADGLEPIAVQAAAGASCIEDDP